MLFPFVPLAIAGGSALASWLGNRKSARTGEQSQSFDYLDSPDLTGGQTSLRDSLIQQAMNRLFSDPSSLVENLITSGVLNINRGADARKTSFSRALASRGLSRSPAAAASIAGLEGDRISDIVRFRNQAPILSNEMSLQNLGAAQNVLAASPMGTLRTGTSQGTNVQPGSAAGSGIGNFATIMAYLYGQGAFGGGTDGGK